MTHIVIYLSRTSLSLLFPVVGGGLHPGKLISLYLWMLMVGHMGQTSKASNGLLVLPDHLLDLLLILYGEGDGRVLGSVYLRTMITGAMSFVFYAQAHQLIYPGQV